MTIQYLKKMEATPVIQNVKNIGIPECEIKRLESLSGVQLPKAYKEFLFLGGKLDNMLDWHAGFDIENMIEIQEMTVETLSDVGYTMPKPFWNFADQDNGEVFLFFFLDEGDDPPVYYCQRSLQDNTDEADYVKWYDSFSACIEGYIELRRTGKI